MKRLLQLTLTGVVCVSVGCSESPAPVASSAVDSTADNIAASDSIETVAPETSSSPVASADQPTTDDEDEFAPLSLGPASTNDSASSSTGVSDQKAEKQINDVITALKPLQVMLGKWSGKTRLDYDGFKAVDQHEWIWDLQSNPNQPSLKISSDVSPYLKDAHLTWDVQQEVFRLTATDKEGVTREFEGTYTDPVHEVVGPDEKLHKVFRLQLTQTADSQASVDGANYQLAFVQQENNRYLLEVDRRRGKAAFRRYDTVSTQREGTSFAVSDSDYGEKTCIISQGLGTMPVSYKGKSYWVCCSGCKAAFDADPEKWIARAATRDKSM